MSFIATIKGLSLGAAAMYYFDPNRGRARRSLLRDKCVHWQHLAQREIEIGIRDLNNRLCGLSAEAGSLLRGRKGETSNETLEARVRSQMGHLVSHPHAIGVTAHEGCISLSGPILAHEVAPLLRQIARVPGIDDVQNNLDIHEEPGDISALQGGCTAACGMQWTPATRLLVGAGSTLSLVHGLVNRSRFCTVLGMAGIGMVMWQASTSTTGRTSASRPAADDERQALPNRQSEEMEEAVSH